MSDADYKRLSRKCIVSMYVGYVIYVAALAIFYRYIISHLSDRSQLVFAIVAAVLLSYLIVAPIVFYKRYRYIITKDKVDIRYGIIFVRHILVPMERIHQVEVVKGPVNNLFGLADVTMTTGGGVAKLRYLKVAEAESVAKELHSLVGDILKGRKQDV